MARRHRPLFPLPCPRRNRYAPSSSSQSPLSSVSAWRRKLRPLPCSSSPNRTRLRWASIWVAASPPNTGEFFAKSAQLRFRLAAKTTPAPLLLLSKSNPLALGFDLVGGFAAACGRIFCKVRSAPLPPGGENCARSLAPPLQIEPACAGLRFGWRLRRRLGEKRPGLGKLKSWDRTDAQTRAGTGDAYSGKIRPSPARGNPRRRCPQ